MLSLLTAPAMATHPGFTTFAEVVNTHGLLNTAKSLQMAHRTVAVRAEKPGTFTLPELLNLAALTETKLSDIVTQLAKEVTPSAEKPGAGTRVEIGGNSLTIRMKNLETMSSGELAMLAKLSGSTVANITSHLAAQKAKNDPTTIAELIHGMGGRYDTAAALGMSPSTLASRMKKPEGFTLADLVAVAKVSEMDLVRVIELARYQMENHIPPPAPAVGRPSLND